jgi:hypothetical protein
VYCQQAVTGHHRAQTVLKRDSLAGANSIVSPDDEAFISCTGSVHCVSGLLATEAMNRD